VTRYADVHAVLRDTTTFSSEVGGAATIEDLPEDVLEARRNFLEFDPPKHGRYRRLLEKVFSVANVRALKPRIGITGGLAQRGVTAAHLPRLVELATADICHQTNPRPCVAADFERLFRAAM